MYVLQPSSSFVETPCSPLNVEVSSCGQILLLPTLTRGKRGKCFNNLFYCDEGYTYCRYKKFLNYKMNHDMLVEFTCKENQQIGDHVAVNGDKP